MTRFWPFLASAGAILIVLAACGLLSPARSPRVERFECQVRALEPLVGEVYDSRELLRDLYAGRASLGAVLTALGASQAEAMALVAALQACDASPEPPDAGLEAL